MGRSTYQLADLNAPIQEATYPTPAYTFGCVIEAMDTSSLAVVAGDVIRFLSMSVPCLSCWPAGGSVLPCSRTSI